ncbi:MAG: mtfB [Limisphaerales bacterium]|nr:MAG: mtfB [Limisphaerales bacterium]KAG0508300.1 MAG: mtfB [Limisphaerales bacterium]TXT49615.1 MAG: mtfB [Limisphaerales bacterium]
MNARPLTLTCSLADQLFVQTKSVGIFNLSLGLVEQLARRPEISRLTVLANRTLAGRLPGSLDVRWHDAPARGRLGRIWWDQWGVYSAATATANDWLFLPKGFASFARACPRRLAACVADTIHDFYQTRYPQSGGALERGYFVRSFWGTVRHARVIFTISDFTSGEIARLARARGVVPPPIHTIGIGFTRPAPAAVPQENRLCVLASPFPHKRTDLAVDWLARWQRESGFAGTVDWVGGLPTRLVMPNFSNWQRHERLPEEAYRRLLARAKALVFFSEYEGFGMPPVEAVLAGACPVFSDIPATREVMGDAGFAFANSDYESFRAAMNSALAVPREQIGTWAGQLLIQHDWKLVLDRFVAGLQAAQAETQLTPARP